MAARSQLVNRRRRNYPQYYQDPPPLPEPDYAAAPAHDPMWTEEELAQARARQLAAAEKEQRKLEAKAGKGTEEDPFKVFGKMVKGVFKKKSSKKDRKKGQGAEEGITGDPEKQIEEIVQMQTDIEEPKLDELERPSRTGSSSSEEEPRSGSEDTGRADTPSSEDSPPQVPPKQDLVVQEDKLNIDPALLEALSITPSPPSPESQPELLEENATLSTGAPALPPSRPVPPCPSPMSSPTDAQGRAL